MHYWYAKVLGDNWIKDRHLLVLIHGMLVPRKIIIEWSQRNTEIIITLLHWGTTLINGFIKPLPVTV